MATEAEYLAAANTPPSKRSSAEQDLVSRGQNMQSVRNADFEARRHEGVYGR